MDELEKWRFCFHEGGHSLRAWMISKLAFRNVSVMISGKLDGVTNVNPKLLDQASLEKIAVAGPLAEAKWEASRTSHRQDFGDLLPLAKEIIKNLPNIDAKPGWKLPVPMITNAGNQEIPVVFSQEDLQYLVSYKDRKLEELLDLLNTGVKFLSDDDCWFAVGVIADALFKVPEGKLSHFKFWLTLRTNTRAAV